MITKLSHQVNKSIIRKRRDSAIFLTPKRLRTSSNTRPISRFPKPSSFLSTPRSCLIRFTFSVGPFSLIHSRIPRRQRTTLPSDCFFRSCRSTLARIIRRPHYLTGLSARSRPAAPTYLSPRSCPTYTRLYFRKIMISFRVSRRRLIIVGSTLVTRDKSCAAAPHEFRPSSTIELTCFVRLHGLRSAVSRRNVKIYAADEPSADNSRILPTSDLFQREKETERFVRSKSRTRIASREFPRCNTSPYSFDRCV